MALVFEIDSKRRDSKNAGAEVKVLKIFDKSVSLLKSSSYYGVSSKVLTHPSHSVPLLKGCIFL